MARWASFIVLLGILLVVAILFLQVMQAFLLPMFLAVLLVVMFRPVHRWILAEVPRYPRLAAGLTTAAILLIVLVPFAWILAQAGLEGASLAGQFKTEEVTEKLGTIRKDLRLHMPYAEQLGTIDTELGRLQPKDSEDGDPVPPSKLQIERSLGAIAASLDMIARSLNALPAQEKDVETTKALQEATRVLGAVAQNELKVKLPTPNIEGENAASLQTLPTIGKPKTLSPDVAAKLLTMAQEVQDAAKVVLTTNAGVGAGDGEAVAAIADSADLALRYQSELADLSANFFGFRSTLLGGPLMAWIKAWTNPTPEKLNQLRAEVLGHLESWWAPLALGTTQFLGSLVIGTIVMIVSLYFFLADGPGMVQALMRLSPLDERYEQQLVGEFDRVSRAVVVATLLSAFVQGLLAGAGFYLAGLEAVFLLTVLTMFLALIPFVGATAVWLPCSLYVFFYQGRPLAGVLLALYGACVVSVADNIIKPIILHGQSNLHPLLALLSVLGGVRALGPIGIFVGPMAVAFLQALLNILNVELKNLEERREAGGEGPLIPRLSGPGSKPQARAS
ncbi:MAG: AI-2E family transporter [Pirellulales bacterium]